MPKSTLAGHPLHPILVGGPLGLFPFSLVLDVMHLRTGERSYARGAYYSMMGGLLSGAAAAVAGAFDYFVIPPKSRAKRTANLHALLNVGVMGMYAVNLMARRGRRVPSGPGLTALSVVSNLALLVSGWYGGTLVYEHGMRVKGVSPIADAPELKLPGDEMLEEAFHRVEEAFAPEDAPQERLPRAM